MAVGVRWRGIRTSGVALEPARVSVALKDFDGEAEAAAAHVRAAVAELGDVRVGPDTAFVGVSRDGVVVMAEDVLDVRAWITHLCTALESRGVHGLLVAAPSRWPPLSAYPTSLWPQPAALLGYRLATPWTLREGGKLGSGWGVDPAVTADLIQQAVTWLSAVDGETFAIQGLFSSRVQLEDLPELMQLGIRHDQKNHARRIRRRPLESASVELSSGGEVAYQHCVAGQPAIEHLDHLRAALLWRPELVDWAIIRYTPGVPSRGWRGGYFNHYPAPPQNTNSTWTRHRHLWERFVPDANGIQLLTTHHVERARDLSGWTVTPAGTDRWLVEAADLGAWFGPTTSDEMVANQWPDPAVLAQARSDFGPLILTPQSAEENPPPIA